MRELADDRGGVEAVASPSVGALVLLLDEAEPGVELSADAVEALAALGVTNVTVLRGERKVAVALEGWAFDVDRSAEDAARAVGVARQRVSVLRPVLESAIHRLRGVDVKQGRPNGERADDPASVGS
jgi:hypothetical protein